MQLNEITGKKILDSNANSVGKAEDLECDIQTWKVTPLVVKVGYTTSTAVPIEQVSKVGEKIILKVTKEDLKL